MVSKVHVHVWRLDSLQSSKVSVKFYLRLAHFVNFLFFKWCLWLFPAVQNTSRPSSSRWQLLKGTWQGTAAAAAASEEAWSSAGFCCGDTFLMICGCIYCVLQNISSLDAASMGGTRSCCVDVWRENLLTWVWRPHLCLSWGQEVVFG